MLQTILSMTNFINFLSANNILSQFATLLSSFSQNIKSKFITKAVTIVTWKQNSSKMINRATPQKNITLKNLMWVHWNLHNFINGGVPLCTPSMHWDTPPRRKLQQNTIRYFETIFQSGCHSDWKVAFFF